MEMMISVIVKLVPKMKEIVILMMTVKMVLFVDQRIAQLHLVLTLKLIVVIPMIIHAMIPVIMIAGKMMIIVMMKTMIVDVNGMEETVVVIMLTQLGVQLVNV